MSVRNAISNFNGFIVETLVGSRSGLDRRVDGLPGSRAGLKGLVGRFQFCHRLAVGLKGCIVESLVVCRSGFDGLLVGRSGLKGLVGGFRFCHGLAFPSAGVIALDDFPELTIGSAIHLLAILVRLRLRSRGETNAGESDQGHLTDESESKPSALRHGAPPDF
jgi:hypothetical protein